jgi:peptide methionine sulfoxide reductase MsrA
MQISFLTRLVVTSFIGISSAIAAPGIATITASNSPVWLQQGDSKTRLGGNRQLSIGDIISTGATGRVQMELWETATLQLNTDSEIAIRAENDEGNDIEASRSELHPVLYIHQGRACIDFTAEIGSNGLFKLNLGDTMFAAIHHHGEICVLRRGGQNYIKLRAGSVQITHSVDPNMIILSESGSEIHMEDSGSYRLLFPGDDLSALEIEKPFTLEIDGEEIMPTDLDDSGDSEVTRLPEAESATTAKDEGSAYIYTVYLFSTRDEEVAQKINQKFLKAGHDTQIIESTSDSIKHYRLAATGFDSSQAAKDFANSIVGKFGVTETWIGRDLQLSPSGELSAIEIENPLNIETDGEETRPTDLDDSGDSEISGLPETESETPAKDEGSAYIYTVYLFSTRDEEVAQKINERFLKADHDTQIIESTTGSTLRYRIAASGFESNQAATDFANSIVGKYGVTDTWIGRELQ